MMDKIRAALDPVAAAFGALGVNYRMRGSVASSALGIARSTLDIDQRVQNNHVDGVGVGGWGRHKRHKANARGLAGAGCLSVPTSTYPSSGPELQ